MLAPVVIDGTDGGHRVILSGKNFNAATNILTLDAGTFTDPYCYPAGIALNSSGSTIENLAFVTNNQGAGIDILTNNNKILGNYFGTPDTLTKEALTTGILLDGVNGTADNNTIGGSNQVAAQYNVIVNSTGDGIDITTDASHLANATGNTVAGNYIGVLPTGTATTFGNGNDGVNLSYATGNTIGGTTSADGNYIGNSGYNAVELANASELNTVEYNVIGFAQDNKTAAPNVNVGVAVDSSNNQFIANNTIGNNLYGIYVSKSSNNTISRDTVINNAADAAGIAIVSATSTGNSVTGSYIGTDLAGDAGLGNGVGIYIDVSTGNTIGGSAALANTITGNNGPGVRIDDSASQNTVSYNLIGLNNGTPQLGNADEGVLLLGSSNQSIANNTIGYNTLSGVKVDGTTSAATTNTITANIIIKNGGEGVWIAGANATGNIVTLNDIGTDPTGLQALGNTLDGVFLDDASSNYIGTNAANATGLGNTISYNVQNGVLIANGAGSETISQNKAIDYNGANGIDIDFTGTGYNTISGNVVIDDNAQNGVLVDQSDDNQLTANTIDCNGQTGAGYAGVMITGNGVLVAGVYVGTTLTGNTIEDNNGDGVTVAQSADNIIGTTGANSGNTISNNVADKAGNNGNGIQIIGNAPAVAGITYGNSVTGNTIDDNYRNGVYLNTSTAGATFSIVAGVATNNTISANIIDGNGLGNATGLDGNGVHIDESPSNLLTNNSIDNNTLNGVLIDGAGAGKETLTVTPNNTQTIDQNGADGVDVAATGAGDNTISYTTIDNNTLDGVLLAAGGNTLTENTIDQNGNNGVDITSDANTLINNSIGANQYNGVLVSYANDNQIIDGNTIGSNGQRDTAGSSYSGVMIVGNGTLVNNTYAGTTVSGNYIGVTEDGYTADGNIGNGVTLMNSDGNTIGAGNQIGSSVLDKDNQGNGIRVVGNDNPINNVYVGNQIFGNDIGVLILKNVVTPAGNAGDGIDLVDTDSNTIGGAVAGMANVIGENATGIEIDGNGALVAGAYVGNTVIGNQIGVYIPASFTAIPNGNGVLLSDTSAQSIGLGTQAQGNLIADNRGDGVLIQGNALALSGVTYGNFLTTNTIDSNGVNTPNGVEIDGSANNTLTTNTITRNAQAGVFISGAGASGNTLVGNYLGTTRSDNLLGVAAGLANYGNHGDGLSINGYVGGFPSSSVTGNSLDGTTAAGPNVVSGNGANGVVIVAVVGNNPIIGNYIGTDPTGLHPLGNGVARYNGQGEGVWLTDVQKQIIGPGNVISANLGDGVQIGGGTSDQIVGNLIGVNKNGVDPTATSHAIGVLGNREKGVYLNSFGVFSGQVDNPTYMVVGGSLLNSASTNVIANNGDSGVAIIGAGIGTMDVIAGNYIGTNAANAPNLGNADGVKINNAALNTIGGVSGGISSGLGNVIANNRDDGVFITGTSATVNVVGRGNVIRGNVQGVSIRDGAIQNSVVDNNITSNTANGVLILDSSHNYVGSDTISGNTQNGIEITNVKSESLGNYIGGTQSSGGNTISNNGQNGVFLYAGPSQTQIQGNVIETNGTQNSTSTTSNDGVLIDNAPGNVVGGLLTTNTGDIIAGNLANGVAIMGSAAQGNLVAGSFIGLTADGKTALANGQNGVVITNATLNTIGGTQGVNGNIISGNTLNGVLISGGSGNRLLGNRIGTNAAGTIAVPNGVLSDIAPSSNATTSTTNSRSSANGFGVELLNTTLSVIGQGNAAAGKGPGNLISGNYASGVLISGGHTNSLAGNVIGLDVTGENELPNNANGVYVLNSSGNIIGVAGRNVISANFNPNVIQVVIPFSTLATDNQETANVFIEGTQATTGNVVQGNYIGTDITGETDATKVHILPQTLNPRSIAAENLSPTGVAVYGAWSNTIQQNVISGNDLVGVVIQAIPATGGSTAQNNNVFGNFIGTDATGTKAIGNGLNNTGDSAILRANDATTFPLPSTTGLLSPIGAGVLIDGARNNFIGGASVADRNIISGNNGTGVEVSSGLPSTPDGKIPFGNATGNQIVNNFIGVDVTGENPLDNRLDGVYIENAGDTTIKQNVISANDQSGIDLLENLTQGTVITGNLIGYDATGTKDPVTLSNAAYGILFDQYVGATTQTNNKIAPTDVSTIYKVTMTIGAQTPYSKRPYFQFRS